MNCLKSRRLPLGISLALALVTLAAFGAALSHGFVDFDDHLYVTENPEVLSGLNAHSLRWAFTTGLGGNWHPLAWVSHMFDAQFFGLHPAGHHLTSLLLHAANAVLLFLVLRRMTGALWRSAFVAALFALHPLHVESVAWVSERKDVLSAFFFLLALGAYARYAQGRSSVESQEPSAPALNHQPSTLNYLAALFFFALGLMSKPMVVTLPFVLLLLDLWPLQRLKLFSQPSTLWPLLREKLPFFGLTVLSSVVTFIVQQKGGAMVLMATVPLKGRLANALQAVCGYLFRTFWPLDLAAFYPFSNSFSAWNVLAAGILVLGLTLFALAQVRRRPYLLVGWLWFLGMLVPVIGIVQVGLQALADRYTYLPLIGCFVSLTWAGAELAQRWPQGPLALRAVALAVLVACAGLTFNQVSYWADTKSLFARALAVTANNSVAEYGLGRALMVEGDYDEAIPHLREAVRIDPKDGDSWCNLGVTLAFKGQFEEAAAAYRSGLAGQPKNPAGLHYNLANVLVALQQPGEARAEYERALQLNPALADCRRGLARILRQQGHYPEAEAQYRLLLEREPANPDGHIELGQTFAEQSQWDSAAAELRAGLRLRPEDLQAQVALGSVLLQAGEAEAAYTEYLAACSRSTEVLPVLLEQGQKLAAQHQVAAATNCFNLALRLSPGSVEAHRFWGLALAQNHQVDQAIAHFNKVLELRPDAQAHYDLALALVLQHQREQALAHYREAVRLAPEWPDALNDLAWLLATAPQAELRDGTQAVHLAEKACELSHWQEPRFVGTLDAAYAEVGRFQDAITTAQKTSQLAAAAHQGELAKAAAQRLELYQAGKPFRQL